MSPGLSFTPTFTALAYRWFSTEAGDCKGVLPILCEQGASSSPNSPRTRTTVETELPRQVVIARLASDVRHDANDGNFPLRTNQIRAAAYT
jgi:hypothetical protein